MTDVTTPPPAPMTLDVSGTPRTSFGRLVKVEWRKMVDTRGGFWLLAVTALLLLLTMGLVLLVVALNDGIVIAAEGMAEVYALPVSLLMPVFAILIVTSEWGQRTALTTFTLEPSRVRVLLAKFVAVSLLAVLTIVVAVALGALTNVIGAGIAGADAEWNLSVADLLLTVLGQMLFFWMGFGLAMLLLNTPGAIALYYVVGLLLPFMLLQPLYFSFEWARDIFPWVDFTTGTTPVVSNGEDFVGQPIDLGATEYLQFAWVVLLWIVIPVSAGMARILRAEVK